MHDFGKSTKRCSEVVIVKWTIVFAHNPGKQHLFEAMATPTAETICAACSNLELEKKCAACEKQIITHVNKGEDDMQDTRSSTLEELARNVLEKLNHQGYCIIDKFHKEEKALAILEEVKIIHATGQMHNGQLTSTLTSEDIRGDLIKWVDGKDEGTQNIVLHMRRVDALVRELNKMISYHKIEGRTKVLSSKINHDKWIVKVSDTSVCYDIVCKWLHCEGK